VPPSILNPSRVEVAAPAPVILVPINIALATDIPPDNTTAAVPRAEASVALVNVIAPEPAIVVPLNEETVIVLLLSDSVPARVARVPVVGRVTEVLAVVVKPSVCAPVWVKLPPIVIVLPVLATPVPPY